ncbi:MAG TPA: LacI family DNA-binding transcriptional regulator [Pseudomonadales bacterium]|nr:LacI family DNA-binding transcriptional regulator [Pseudomonadales bacterium]
MQKQKDKSAITINDIAALAGVSKRTVSRVLNNSSSVNSETREKILALFAKYDYSPSKQARGLASSRSYLIGLLYDEPNAVVIHEVQKGLISALSPLGYELVVHPMSHDAPRITDHVLKFISRSNLDGVIIMPPISMQEHLLDVLTEKSIPFVCMAAKSLARELNEVVSLDRRAMSQVADLFAARGAKHVAVIKGAKNRLSTIERFEGLKLAMQERELGLLPQHIAEGDYSYDSGVVAARSLLQRKPRPDAIFASNDQMAIASIHVAEDLGIRVPEDLLVIGYDDEPMSSRFKPSLTTLRRDDNAMAVAAAHKMLALLNNDRCVVESAFIPRLVERDSTRR